MAHLTLVAAVSLRMAFLAGPHLHRLETVARQPVFLEKGKLLFLCHVLVANDTVYILGLVRRVREIDVIGLPGIDSPWDFLVLLNIIFDEDALVLGLSNLGFVAFLAFVYPGNPGERAVVPEGMAIFAAASLLLMNRMTKIERLRFLGVEDVRKDHPADDQKKDKARQKHYHAAGDFTGRILWFLCHRKPPQLIQLYVKHRGETLDKFSLPPKFSSRGSQIDNRLMNVGTLPN
jgi:hypothetical protein